MSLSTASKPSPRDKSAEPLLCPFTVTIDTREQSPWCFTEIRGRSEQKYRPLIVPVKVVGLPTGDYSIEGFADAVAVERKSLSDLFGTILGDRERFERELNRLQNISATGFACVICEGRWTEGPPRRSTESDGEYSERAAKQFRSVLGSIRSWRMEFPRVHWLECASRRQAEVECFRILEMFWRRREREAKEAIKEAATLAAGEDMPGQQSLLLRSEFLL